MLRAGQPPRVTWYFWVRLRAPDMPSGFIAHCFDASVALNAKSNQEWSREKQLVIAIEIGCVPLFKA